ncbi:MAG TPA: SPFH domain-containing protein [Gemmatimonadales bacterium]|nr:SPFH domain-containing protein [Gemmatimonadales bacterium]
MGSLVFGGILLFFALILRTLAAGRGPTAGGRILKLVSYALMFFGALSIFGSTVKVIDPGTVGVQHAFGTVNPEPLLPGIRIVSPWSSVERYSTREEQWPAAGEVVEDISALSKEQMGMMIEVAIRYQINAADAPRLFLEIGNQEQIENVVRNAIRNGVRDGMVAYTINDIGSRNAIAKTMESEVDSALITSPRSGGPPFRIAQVTAFFLRDLQPPAQVVQAINNKIAQEQQIETERHRVEVARLQTEQQRLLNQTLTAEALTKQYLEVLHDMRQSNNLVIMVPTEGGVPMLNINDLRNNLRRGQ